MLNYKLSEEAKHDMAEIVSYSKNRWGTQQTKRYLKQLRKRMRWLAQNPKLGVQRNDIKKGYYSFPEGKHFIYYLINQKNIEIIGVLHQKGDVKRHL